MLGAMAIDPGDAIILAYVLVSIGVIIVSLLAALPIGWLVDSGFPDFSTGRIWIWQALDST